MTEPPAVSTALTALAALAGLTVLVGLTVLADPGAGRAPASSH